eukprot:7385930-Prymnesium_polylepis.1
MGAGTAVYSPSVLIRAMLSLVGSRLAVQVVRALSHPRPTNTLRMSHEELPSHAEREGRARSVISGSRS